LRTNTKSAIFNFDKNVTIKYVYQRCSYIVIMSDAVHTGRHTRTFSRILVFAYAEIMRRPPTETDKPILDSSTSVTNLVPNTVKDDEKLMPLSQSDYPHIRFWTERDRRAFQNACSDSPRLKDSSELKSKDSGRGGERCYTGENIMMPYIEEEDETP
jgi:hypothetical protein